MSDRVEALWKDLSGPLRAYFERRVRRPEDAEDLLQECFVRVLSGIDGVADEDRLAAWVQRIASHLVVDARRKGGREPRGGEAAAPEPATPDEPEDLNPVVAGWLARRVDALPPRYREVVRRFELEQASQREIADDLGLSLTAAKSRVRRGRALLRADLLACCSFELDRTGGIVDVRRHRRPDCDC